MPFARGAALLGTLTSMRCSASTMRALTEAAGAELVAAEAHTGSRPAEVASGSTRQQISVDGAMVPLRGGEWREVRTLVIGELGLGGETEPVARRLSYFSRMTDAQTFTDLALGEVLRRGTDQAPTVAAVADGATWCQQFFEYHVPQAVRILDFPHAVEHLSAAAQAVFGPGADDTRAWLDGQRHALRAGSVESVFAALATLPVAAAAQPAQAAQVRDRTLVYLATRRAHLDYATFTAAGLPIGSGAVESANKLVVEARLKGAGMHWSPAQVNPMLALRCALCSDRWDERWRTLTTVAPSTRRRSTQSRPVHVPPPVATGDGPSRAPRPTRIPTIIDGKPTAAHPWKRDFNLRARTRIA